MKIKINKNSPYLGQAKDERVFAWLPVHADIERNILGRIKSYNIVWLQYVTRRSLGAPTISGGVRWKTASYSTSYTKGSQCGEDFSINISWGAPQ